MAGETTGIYRQDEVASDKPNQRVSLTASFREFLKEFAPDAPEREGFYRIRSEIVHGSRLIQFDIRDDWSFGDFKPVHFTEQEEYGKLYQVAQQALVRWLLSKNCNA